VNGKFLAFAGRSTSTVTNRRANNMDAITVSQLIAHLQSLPPNLPIIATWEGLHCPITPANISVNSINEITCVLVDVNEYDWHCLNAYHKQEKTMPKLYTNVIHESGETPYLVLSTEPLTDDVDRWADVGVKVELIGFHRQPDAGIMAGVVRNIFSKAGFEVIMEQS
jgi:hypothetical protein